MLYTEAFEPEPAKKGGFSASFGSLSHICVSIMCFASPKFTQITAPFRSQNFVNKEFFDVRGKNAVNPNGFTSILTMPQRKIFVSKSDSGSNASVYISAKNPLVVDVANYNYESHRKKADAWIEFSEQAEKNRNDAIILLNALDNQLETSKRESTVVLFRESSQAKSATDNFCYRT